MQTRVLIRIAFIVVLTAIAVIWNGGDILLPWHPFSTYGFSADPRGNVTSVDAAAERDGLHGGDRIEMGRLQPADRAIIGFIPLAPAGRVWRLPLASGRVVTVTSHLRLRSMADNVSDVFAVIVLWAYIVIAALLVLLRPSPATWAFYAFSYVFCFTGTLINEYVPFGVLLSSFALGAIASAASPVAFVSFALRFPQALLRGVAAITERALFFVVFPVFAIFNIVSLLLSTFSAIVPPAWASELETVLGTVIFMVGVSILLLRYANADRENRNRLQWIVAALTVAFLPIITTNIVLTWFSVLPPLWLLNCAQAWEVLAPTALAYTVLKHRLFDIRFVFSRALVYALITSLMVGILEFADWGLHRWLAESRFTFFAELGLALLLGATLTAVHRRVELFLNHIIFRAHALAMQALRRFAYEIDLIADPKRLVTQTFEALRARLESEYTAIYTVDGSSFARATPQVGTDATPALLPNDDFVILRLRRWNEAFECDEPAHTLRGALLLPMTARTQLVGFIVCGPKSDRTHYLPDEIETLSTLAHRAGSAFAWLTLRGAATEDFQTLRVLREQS